MHGVSEWDFAHLVIWHVKSCSVAPIQQQPPVNQGWF